MPDQTQAAEVPAATNGSAPSPDAPALRTHTRVRHGLRRPHNWWQLVRFLVVGASGYVVNIAVFALTGPGFHHAIGSFRPDVPGLGLYYVAASVVAFVFALSNNFWWNRHWTFGARDGHAGFQAARFFTVSVGAFLVQTALLILFVSALGMAKVPAQAISILAATPLNFVGNKMWSFGATRARV